MKKSDTLLAVAVIIMFAFSACQKEYDPGPDPNPIVLPSNNDSIYLDQIYLLYDVGAGLDTQDISRLVYDSRKRVVAVINSTLNTPLETDSILYFYNGTDTVPWKMEERVFLDPTGYEYKIDYFFYDAQDRKLKDSSIYYYLPAGGTVSNYTRVFRYSYGTNRTYGEVWQQNSLGTAMELAYKDTAIMNINGDIVVSKRYTLTGGNYVLNTTSSFTYDNHPSPYSKLSMLRAHRYLPNGETILSEYMSFQNIISQQESTIDPVYNFSQNFVYEYNNIGLPKKVRSDVGTPMEETVYFTYKKL